MFVICAAAGLMTWVMGWLDGSCESSPLYVAEAFRWARAARERRAEAAGLTLLDESFPHPIVRCYKGHCAEPAIVLSVDPPPRCLGHACRGHHFVRAIRVSQHRVEYVEFHDESAEIPIPHGCTLAYGRR